MSDIPTIYKEGLPSIEDDDVKLLSIWKALSYYDISQKKLN